MIKIRGLHKFYNKGRQNEIHVINDVTLDLPEKGMVAIFGKSGCGKTTLLNVIGGLDKYSDGTVTIENSDVRDNADELRNKYIGYIFQNYNLNKSESCFDNVADALRLCGIKDVGEIEARVTAALTNVGMEKYSKRTPDTLSGGQQQRIAIARAIVKNPRIILADEPTGNLDEANTVMIMNLLKAISRDHLVLIVTHEANLVDYYCDEVIELHDGKVAGTRSNSAANGYTARDKNDIYLGELDKKELADENATVEYYGDAPNSPVRIKIVNNGGKLYLKLDEATSVQIIDETSEIRLREGIYEEKVIDNSDESIDMSALPPVNGTHFGRLFSFASSLKSGYVANFKSRKKGKKVLRGCMCLFASVVVFMSALFGSSFGQIINAKNAYNHNVFYLYIPNGDVSQKLYSAVGNAETGIDYIRLTSQYSLNNSDVYFRTGSFETFSQYDYRSNFRTNASYLDMSLAKELPLVAGKRDDLRTEEILITTKVADALIEKSSLGYITERSDLIGFVSDMYIVGGKSPRIAGIVESDEPAIYMTELAMAKYVRNVGSLSKTSLASDYGVEVKSGEALLAIRYRDSDITYPKVGETVKIQGRDVKVVAVKEAYFSYPDWLTACGIEKTDEQAYYTELVSRENPELDKDSEEFIRAVDTASNTHFADYYDYYYAEFDDFWRDYYFFEKSDIEMWLYFEKGIVEAKYNRLPYGYYKALKYKELYGRYPSRDQIDKLDIPDSFENFKQYMAMYEEEFYRGENYSSSINNVSYLVSEEDYVAFSRQLGETHPTASTVSYGYKEYGTDMKESIYVDTVYGGPVFYTLIHSSDPEKTAAWLEREFSELAPPDDYSVALQTPDNVFENLIKEKTEDIISGIIGMALLLVLMSVCMYFIMRSSLMNRIKEVGIYRAIGVSRKNLVFKFFVEAIVITLLTVLVGYILSSIFLAVCLGSSSLVSDTFYYPLWLALADLAILCASGLFFGTLPIISLLRKTPSEILAKYDI